MKKVMKIKNEKGMVILVTMMISLIIMIIGYALIDTSILESKITSSIKEYKAMMANVEFGLQYARQQIITNPSVLPTVLYGETQYIIDENSSPQLPTPKEVIGPYNVRLVITIINEGVGVVSFKENIGENARQSAIDKASKGNKVFRIKSVLQENVNGIWKTRQVAEEYVINEAG